MRLAVAIVAALIMSCGDAGERSGEPPLDEEVAKLFTLTCDRVECHDPDREFSRYRRGQERVTDYCILTDDDCDCDCQRERRGEPKPPEPPPTQNASYDCTRECTTLRNQPLRSVIVSFVHHKGGCWELHEQTLNPGTCELNADD